MGGAVLGTRQSSHLRQIVIICVGLLALYVFILVPDASLDSSRTVLDTFPEGEQGNPGKTRLTQELLDNRFLTSEQCTAAFPELTKEIDDAVAKGPFTLEKSGPLGPLIARIRDGRLSVLQATSSNDLSRDMLAHRTATLHQIHTALLTSPSRDEIPDTIIAFTHHDNPSPQTFAYSRPADPSRNGPSTPYFPIPHFSFWSWPLPFIKSLPSAISSISALESALPFSSKVPKAVWRGTPHFNSPSTSSARLRQDLLLTSKSKPWSDIEALAWTSSGRNASNALPVSDFCRYKYIVHTEGVTYSGRLPFHQLCASVVLSPPLSWMQHTSHLVRPVLSSSGLPGVERVARPRGQLGDVALEKVSLTPYPAKWVTEAWGQGVRVEEANMVFVAPDWSDLEAVVLWLEAHPKVAEGIASRQRKMFHETGILSSAAEMCYWRAAIRGWSQVVDFSGQGFEVMEGVPFEEFVLTQEA